MGGYCIGFSFVHFTECLHPVMYNLADKKKLSDCICKYEGNTLKPWGKTLIEWNQCFAEAGRHTGNVIGWDMCVLHQHCVFCQSFFINNISEGMKHELWDCFHHIYKHSTYVLVFENKMLTLSFPAIILNLDIIKKYIYILWELT